MLNTQRKHLPLFRVLRLLSHPGFDSESRIVEVSFEMASPPQFIARVALSDVPGRMATRWALAGLDATCLLCAYQRHTESTLLCRASSFTSA
jgi:hypothetical protein